MKNSCHTLLPLSLFSVHVAFAQQCEQTNLLTNGSFMSVEGSGVTAPGWTGFISPDVNDPIGPLITTPCYVWTGGTPLWSVNGGTWQNLYGPETVSQYVATVPGSSYLLCFEYAGQGITCSSGSNLVDPVGAVVFIDGAVHFTTPHDSSLFTWEYACTNFIATTASTQIKFGLNETQYIAIDGACLMGDSPTDVGSLTAIPPIIAPNPASSLVHVQLATAFDQVAVIDAIGRITMLEARDGAIDLSSMSDGIYLLQCRSQGAPVSATVRLVVVHR